MWIVDYMGHRGIAEYRGIVDFRGIADIVAIQALADSLEVAYQVIVAHPAYPDLVDSLVYLDLVVHPAYRDFPALVALADSPASLDSPALAYRVIVGIRGIVGILAFPDIQGLAITD